jgi:hypothetical protein
MIEPTLPDGSEQHQDMLEKEERLREILLECVALVRFARKYNATEFKDSDIDFVAAACGVSDYRSDHAKK